MNNQVKADCYSAGERRWMEQGQRWRGSMLRPLLVGLTSYRITADHITLASLLFGVAFVPLWYLEYAWTACLFLLIHVLLDGIDGPLARFQETDSQSGSFTDSFCDQLIVSVVAMALMNEPLKMIDVWAGSLFILLYVGVLAISMVRNALRTPYSWLVRPRFFFYASIAIELAGLSGCVLAVIWISNALLALKAISGFFKLRHRLNQKT